jgi:hypothetical protein
VPLLPVICVLAALYSLGCGESEQEERVFALDVELYMAQGGNEQVVRPHWTSTGDTDAKELDRSLVGFRKWFGSLDEALAFDGEFTVTIGGAAALVGRAPFAACTDLAATLEDTAERRHVVHRYFFQYDWDVEAYVAEPEDRGVSGTSLSCYTAVGDLLAPQPIDVHRTRYRLPYDVPLQVEHNGVSMPAQGIGTSSTGSVYELVLDWPLNTDLEQPTDTLELFDDGLSIGTKQPTFGTCIYILETIFDTLELFVPLVAQNGLIEVDEERGCSCTALHPSGLTTTRNSCLNL